MSAAEDILTCQGGTVSTGAGGEPLCSGSWVVNGYSASWDVALSTADIAAIWGASFLTFAIVFCIKLVLRVVLNKTG